MLLSSQMSCHGSGKSAPPQVFILDVYSELRAIIDLSHQHRSLLQGTMGGSTPDSNPVLRVSARSLFDSGPELFWVFFTYLLLHGRGQRRACQGKQREPRWRQSFLDIRLHYALMTRLPQVGNQASDDLHWPGESIKLNVSRLNRVVREGGACWQTERTQGHRYSARRAGGPAYTRRFLFSPLPRPLLRYRVRRDHSWGAPRPCDRSLAQEYKQTPTEARGNRCMYDKARGKERARTSGAVFPPLETIFVCSKFDT